MAGFGCENTFPLSLNQRNIWDLECTFAGTSINNIGTTLRIQGRVDFALLQKTLNLVIASDPSLRTRITLRNGEPVQYSAPFAEETFPVYDFTSAGDTGLSVWENTLTREPIPLLEAPLYRFILFRTGEHSGGVFIKIHHIISDGWSQALICNRIAGTYFDLLSDRPVRLEDAPSYELHVQDEQDYLSSSHYAKDKSYWATQLSGFSEPSVIRDLKGAAVSPVGRRVSFDLPQHLNHAIYSFCIKNRVAPFAVFYMALAIYFKRTGGADRFTIGVPIFNRTNYLFKQCTGMFVSTLPFINEIRDTWTFSEFNENLAEAWYELIRHQRFPFRDITAMANCPDARLFQIAFSYQDSRVYESHDTSVLFSGRWHYGGYQAEQLCIHLSNLNSPRQYAVDYDYLTQFFSESEITALHNSLMNLLTDALANQEKPLCRLSMLGADEREQVLYTFNRTAKYVGDQDAFQMFSKVADAFPNRVALIHQGERLTYRALAARAAAASAAIQSAAPDTRSLAAILLPRDFSLFAALIGTLRAGWAYLLIAEETPTMRTLEILRQSGAALLISNETLAVNLQTAGLDLPILFVDAIPERETPTPVSAKLTDLAYVIYTSGSTGAPKGVEITQAGLVNLAQAMAGVYGNGAVLSLCSVGFDAFVLESAAALLNGRTIVLPEETEIESPRRLARLILSYAVGFLATTPSRLYALLKDQEFHAAIRILDCIVCGGEAFPRELLRTLSACTDARIYNQYGPSEATVAVSHKLLNGTAAITAGAPLQNCHLYVLDTWQNPLPIGVYGELYIGGVCVGRGYRNAPTLTEEHFLPSPFESGERLYRTGDIACWTEAGEILLAGRRDRQIKLRGLRVEPQEISSCIAAHPHVLDAVARVLDLAGQTIIAVYYTADFEIPEVELLTFAAAYLPRYMLPAFLRRVDAIPLTPNGKVDEALLPPPDPAGTDAPAPADGLVLEILSVFNRVLQKSLTPDSDYFLSGGSSLTAMQALSEIEEGTGCLLRTSDLYACRTARRLAQYIAQRRGDAPPDAPVGAAHIGKAPRAAHYPLSPVQRGIYFQTLLDESGLLYNMSGAFRLSVPPDPARLELAFQRLIADDEIFRTSFVQEPDGVFAHVAEAVPFHLQILEGADLETAQQTFTVPFDLTAAPLLRAGLWTDPQDRSTVLFLDTHHIISDGLTTPITFQRLTAYYRGETPVLPDLFYTDYSCYLVQSGGAQEADRHYWQTHLSPMPAPLSLPTDMPRGHEFCFRGEAFTLPLAPDLCTDANTFCNAQGISVYTLFLAAFGYLLNTISGQSAFTVGVPVTDRTQPALQELCGPFLNVLPAKLSVNAACTVRTYLNAVQAEVSAILDHSTCTPEEIAGLLSLPRDPARNPLYSVMLSMRPFDVTSLTFDGKAITYIPLETHTAKAELGLDIALENGIYVLHFEYASGLFTGETIALYARSLAAILSDFLRSPDTPLASVQPISLSDRTLLLDIPDHTYKPFLNMPVHEIARREALLHPEAPAVIFHNTPTTCLQLEQRACQIANILAAAGAAPGGQIGLAMRRTPELLAAMLAILKTGCAYVPLLATLPEKRLTYMAETAGLQVILCDTPTLAELPEALQRLAIIPGTDAADTFVSAPVAPSDLINVLFTSGSTGRPKGVMIRHSSISNLLSNMAEALACVTRPMICATTPIFDIFITESLLPLAMGKTIILADEEEMLLPWRLAGLIEEFDAGFIQFTASRLAMCLTNDAFCAAARHLQFTIVGGEQVSPALVSKFKSHSQGRLVNLYGPTEAAVYITMTDLQADRHVTIGKPMHNCRVYVLDENRRRVPPTAVGELYLAGAGISTGYIAHPELTEAAFFPDPFVPGEIMYKSGDLGRLRADGCFDCCGRCDAQIKINGQRLETGEIVNTILNSGLTDQAVVLPIDGSDGMAALHAFCVRPGQSDCSDLADYLRAYLPDYMVPRHFHVLSEMPHTPGGKADLTRLREMAANTPPAGTAPGPQTAPSDVHLPRPLTGGVTAALSRCAEHTSAPKSPLQGAVRPPLRESDAHPDRCAAPPKEIPSAEDLLIIWSDVLGKPVHRADQSFFEQGGTSLGALNVLSRYSNIHIKMGISEFYRNPTAAAQAAWIAQTAGVQASISPTPASEASQPLPRHVPQTSSAVHTRSKAAFVTGATGFFGAHLVRALLAQGVPRVICLVRGEPDRLLDTLRWYFGAGWSAGAAGRIETVPGDITQPQMGMPQEIYDTVAGTIGTVYHAAADVRHYAADTAAFMDSNVAGTKMAIALAARAGAVLHYISSLSVSGEYLVDAPDTAVKFTEQDFDIGQNWRENLYVKSKMLAEAEIYSAMRQGLSAKVYRLGRLVGRAADGVFQRNPENNMFFLFVQAVRDLGVFPADMLSQPMDLTPVDTAAEAVAALDGAAGTVMHIMNPTPISLREILAVLVPRLRTLDRAEFDAFLAEAAGKADHSPLFSLLLDFSRRHDAHSVRIEPTCLETLSALDAAGFHREIPPADTLLTGISAILS